MKEIIAWTVNVWRMYWGNGWIPYLLALGGACALIFGKKKKNSLSLVLYSVFLLVLFFCPFSGRVIMDRAGDPGAGFDRSYCCFWDRNDKSRKFRKSF